MTWRFDVAGPGAVALMGELPTRAVLSLGFGTSKEAAATLAASSLMEDFDAVWRRTTPSLGELALRRLAAPTCARTSIARSLCPPPC